MALALVARNISVVSTQHLYGYRRPMAPHRAMLPGRRSAHSSKKICLRNQKSQKVQKKKTKKTSRTHVHFALRFLQYLCTFCTWGPWISGCVWRLKLGLFDFHFHQVYTCLLYLDIKFFFWGMWPWRQKLLRFSSPATASSQKQNPIATADF